MTGTPKCHWWIIIDRVLLNNNGWPMANKTALLKSIEFRETPGGPNIVVAADGVTVNDQSGAGITLDNTFNPDLAMVKEINLNFDIQIYIQFPTPRLVTEVVLTCGTDDTKQITQFHVNSSEDGQSWEYEWNSNRLPESLVYVANALVQSLGTITYPPTAHRNWRVVCSSALQPDATQVFLMNVQLRSLIGGPNEAGGFGQDIYYESSQFQFGNAASCFTIRDQNFLRLSPQPAYLTARFPVPKSIKELALVYHPDFAADSSYHAKLPAHVALEYSDDDVTWQQSNEFTLTDASYVIGTDNTVFVGSAFDVLAPTLFISPPIGLYHESILVELSLSETGTIHYSLDGTEPTTLYTGSFALDRSRRLKVRALDNAGNPTVFDGLYTIDPVITQVLLPRGIAANLPEGTGIADGVNQLLFKDDSLVAQALTDAHTGPTQPLAGVKLWHDTETMRTKFNTGKEWVETSARSIQPEQNFGGFVNETHVVNENGQITLSNDEHWPMFYTFDGSTPTIYGPFYTGPLPSAGITQLDILTTDNTTNVLTHVDFATAKTEGFARGVTVTDKGDILELNSLGEPGQVDFKTTVNGLPITITFLVV